MESTTTTTSVQEAAAMLQYKRICQKVIPGGLGVGMGTGWGLGAAGDVSFNVIDWGWHGLLAYGCRSIVVVVDTVNVQIIQTLYEHPCSAAIVKVRWSKNWSCRPLRVASADAAGNIIVWDVAEGKQLCNLFDGHSNRPISALEWVSSTENAYDMLAALHSPHSLIIWNTQTGTKLWKKNYKESLYSLTFDPFCSSNIAFLGKDCILLIDDFSLNKIPSNNERKFFVSSQSSGASMFSTVSEDKGGGATRYKLRNRVRLLVGADSKPSRSEEATTNGECLALAYHPAFRHHLLLSYTREVLIVDLEINQTVGIVTLERNSSPFVLMLPCSQRNALCCLHENGMLSMHVRRSRDPVENCESDNSMEMVYDTIAQSDPIRLTKLHRVLGVAICPTTECSFSLLLSDGRVLFLDLQPRSVTNPIPMMTLLDLEPPMNDSDSRIIPSKLKFVLTGVLQNVAASPLVVRMCPPLTMHNWSVYEPLLAAGSTTGLIQILDMSAGMLHKELTVHTYPVRGIEWVSLTAILSFAHQNLSNSNGQVKNELFLTDIPTGKSKMLRSEKPEESPIEMIRVSSLKQYFIVAFKDEPFELWDLRSLTLLRAMPKRFPIITALEWMPTRTPKQLKSQPSLTECDGISSESIKSNNLLGSFPPTYIGLDTVKSSSSANIGVREQFTFMDTDSQLYQFYVEGSVIKEGAKLPRESGMGSITTLAWKGVIMVMGDVDGNLTMWDLRSKKSQSIMTRRGWIKKVRFAPGRGNMKVLVLYSDGVDIWDIVEAKLIGQVRSPKDIPGVDDVDWAASDRPVLVTKDGCLRIMNAELQNIPSPMRDWACLVEVWCPVILPQSLNAFNSLIHARVFDDSLLLLKPPGDTTDVVTGNLRFFNEYMQSIDQIVLSTCGDCPLKLVHHCLMIARLFGYEAEIRFWLVASKYLREELKRKGRWLESQCTQCRNSHLDESYDLLCDTDTYKRLQLNRLAMHQAKSDGMSDINSRRCSETLLLLRETDRAVRHLLETDPNSEHFYIDSLRACVAAGVHAASHSAQSTVKLVATNLIANGCVTEGVQLLCLIGKGLDACRYLQSYGQWEKAMWLAKCTLDETECLEVGKRWSDHLSSAQADQPRKAVLLLLSMHQFARAIEKQISSGFVETAAVFTKICEKLGVLETSETTNILA